MVDQIPPNSDATLPDTSAVPGEMSQRRQLWRTPAILTIALVLAVLAIFWQTSWSMVSIWIRSETFTHGFLILPISAYLIWQRRKDLLQFTPAPNWWGIPLLIGLGLVWLVAHSASVLVLEQLAMMAMIPTLVWTVLGWQVAWAIAFPLVFLIFAVPMGEELIPYMMDFTANFTVSALQLTGIPVYHEGTFFEIPSGHWSVVEGCSGVRYLIASVTLGCLYAYLTYRTLWRRLLFIAASVIVPVIANGLRAYMIVMIAHLSDMRLALGVDHLIYGWVFFGVVMLLLFWLGSFWREDIDELKTGELAYRSLSNPLIPASRKSFLAASGAVLIAVAVWPAMGSYMSTVDDSPINVSLATPVSQGGWQRSAQALTSWRPRYFGTDAAVDQTYRHGDQQVSLYIAYYRRQRQGSELINTQNVLIPQKDPVWRQTADSPYVVTIDGKRWEVRLAKMRSRDQDLLVWYWFWVNGRTTTNHYLAKLWDAKAKLLGEKGDAAAIVISTPLTGEIGEAEAVLKTYISAMQSSIETSLENTERE
jgi:exosortase A